MQGPASYGAADALPPQYDAIWAKAPLRRAWNARAICLTLLVPWAVFAAAMAVMSFPMQYSNIFLGPGRIATLVHLACLIVIFVFGWFAIEAWQQKRLERVAEPTWHTFLFATTLLAWLLALAAGDYNFEINVSVFNGVSSLGSYRDVDPAKVDGQRLMDAGIIAFSEGTRLDLTRSMGFKMKQIYCVAPIVSRNATPAIYDFWAVGTGCCSEHKADFKCGEYNNELARSGLRLVSTTKREYYQLAVQQAEATHGLLAPNPILLTWMQEPEAELEQYSSDAARLFLLLASSYGLFQACLMAAMAVVLMKFGW